MDTNSGFAPVNGGGQSAEQLSTTQPTEHAPSTPPAEQPGSFSQPVQQPVASPYPAQQPAQAAQQPMPSPYPAQPSQQAASPYPAPAQPAQQPAPQQVPIGGQGGQASYQQSPYPSAAYGQAPNAKPKSNSLTTVAGIVLIAVSTYFLISSIVFISSFLSAVASSRYLSISDYNWPVTIFEIITYFVFIGTGLFALLFSKKVEKAQLLLICSAIAGGLLVITLCMDAFNFLQLLIGFGADFFELTATIFFAIRVPYLIAFLFSSFLLVLNLAAAVVLFMRALSMKKQRAR